MLDEWSNQVAWPVRPVPEAEPSTSTTGRWLVVGNTEMANEIARVVGSDSVGAGRRRRRGRAARGAQRCRPCAVCAAGGGRPPRCQGRPMSCSTQVRRLAAAMVAAPVPAKLFLVTRNAQPIAEGDRANPAHASAVGTGPHAGPRASRNLGRRSSISTTQCPPGWRPSKCWTKLGATDGEDQVVYRAGVRHVPRLQRRATPSASPVELRRRWQPAGHRGYRQYRAASDPPARCDGRRNHRRGVTQSRSTAGRAGCKALPRQGRTW